MADLIKIKYEDLIINSNFFKTPQLSEEERKKKIEEMEDRNMLYGIHPSTAID
jgi:hypothetical protein